MHLPSHPETDDAPASGDQATNVNWGFVLLVVAIGALLALMVVLHLTGVVGPQAH